MADWKTPQNGGAEEALGQELADWAPTDWVIEEYDTPEEVEAVFRAQRRLSFRYGGPFLAATITLPVLNSTWGYWVHEPLGKGFTLAYLAAAFLYPIFCVLLGLAYTLQANRLEEDLLGRRR